MCYIIILLTGIFCGLQAKIFFDIIGSDNYSSDIFWNVIALKLVTFVILMILKRVIFTKSDDDLSLPFVLPNLIANISYLIILVFLSLSINTAIKKDNLANQQLLLFFLLIFIAISYLCNIIMVRISMEKLHQKNNLENENRVTNLKLEYYKNKFYDEEMIRRMYHDMKNHMIILDGHTEDIAYHDALYNKLFRYNNYVNSGNNYVDIILRDKLNKCDEYNISVHLKLDMQRLTLEPIDICSLIGNLFDNAVESCMKVSIEERFIKFSSSLEGDHIIIRLENSVAEPVIYSGNIIPTTKKDKRYHGLGLSIVENIIEKNGGWYTMNFKNNICIMIIALSY